jgi:hypothetical protein
MASDAPAPSRAVDASARFTTATPTIGVAREQDPSTGFFVATDLEGIYGFEVVSVAVD